MEKGWGHHKEGNSPPGKCQRLTGPTVPGHILQDFLTGEFCLLRICLLRTFVACFFSFFFLICLLCSFPIPGYLLQNSLALNMMILIMLKRFPSLGWIYPIYHFWYYFNIYLNQTLSELGVSVLNTITYFFVF